MLNINRTLMRICHPASWRGSGLITTPYPGLTPWAMESVALSGSEFLGLSARQIPIYRAEGASSKMLQMVLFSRELYAGKGAGPVLEWGA